MLARPIELNVSRIKTEIFPTFKIGVPRETRPGIHSIRAVEQPKGSTAKQSFLVQTNWSQFRFVVDGRRVNQYENVLSPKTVGRLKLKWSYPTGGTNFSSATVTNGAVYVGGIQ